MTPGKFHATPAQSPPALDAVDIAVIDPNLDSGPTLRRSTLTSTRLLVGDLDSDGFDDVVMFNSDLTFDVFANDQAGRFKPPQRQRVLLEFGANASTGASNPLLTASSQFFMRDFGNGATSIAGLLGVVGKDFKLDDRGGGTANVGIVTIKSDGRGGFERPNLQLVELSLLTTPPPRTSFIAASLPPRSKTSDRLPITSAFAGVFANVLHGNAMPDLGFHAKIGVTETRPGQCPGDPRPNPGPGTVEVCEPDNHQDCPVPCPHGSHQNLCLGPCGIVCHTETTPAPQPVCQSSGRSSYIIVMANSCND
jgi:hypothetical protein